jgi:Spy/CpxP family protein refolding chaperone
MKKMSILMVGVVLVLSASLALAGPWGSGGGMAPGYGMAPYAAPPPNLNAEQSAKLQTLRESHLKEIAPLQNQLLSKRAELRLLWGKQNPDQAEITAKQKEIFELQQQLQAKLTQYQLKGRNMLTPEQQSQMGSFEPGYGRGYGPRKGRW